MKIKFLVESSAGDERHNLCGIVLMEENNDIFFMFCLVLVLTQGENSIKIKQGDRQWKRGLMV